MVEFGVVALPLLFLGIAALETGRWFVVRHAVTYALFEAARSGTVEHARRAAVERAFERALVPLLGGGLTDLTAGHDRVRQVLAARAVAWGLPPLRLDIVGPAKADFDDYADPALEGSLGAGSRVIDNDYQQERHRRDDLRRYPGGIGPRSGHTRYDVNLLVLRLVYLHEPMLPGLRAVMRSLVPSAGRIDATTTRRLPASSRGEGQRDTVMAREPGDADHAGQAVAALDGYVAEARRRGLLVIVRDMSMPMQSHAMEETGTP